MQKVFIVLLAAAALGACSSTPTAQSTSSPASDGLTPVESEYQSVYDEHRSNFILTGAESHTVKKGDTLANIARYYYGQGNGFYYPLIMAASSEVVLDPDLIIPGMKLTVPNLQANRDNAVSRAALKELLVDVAEINRSRGRAADRDGMLKIANSL